MFDYFDFVSRFIITKCVSQTRSGRQERELSVDNFHQNYVELNEVWTI